MYKLHKIPNLYFSRATHSQIAIIGGGTGGLNASAQLIRDGHVIPQHIRVFEPRKLHAYQAGWTMVAGGLDVIGSTIKPLTKVLHKGINITDSPVAKINADQNTIETIDGDKFTYDQLIISCGAFYDFSTVKGLQEQLDNIDAPVGTIFHYKYAVKINKMVKEFEGGKVIFTEAWIPRDCGGSPSTAIFLTEDRLKQKGIKSDINLYKANSQIFGIKKYAELLNQQCDQKGIKRHFKQELIEVQDHKAIFQDVETKQPYSVDFDFLHVVPVQKPHKFIANSGLGNEIGYVNVNPNTLQHVKYTNIWAIGDCASVPTSKTAAAIMAETPIVIKNLVRQWKHKLPPLPEYEGYTSFPIFTCQNRLLLTEFKYNQHLDETFPIFQSSDSKMMYYLKKLFFPFAYWHLMVRGWWGGRDGIRFLKGA